MDRGFTFPFADGFFTLAAFPLPFVAFADGFFTLAAFPLPFEAFADGFVTLAAFPLRCLPPPPRTSFIFSIMVRTLPAACSA